MYRTIVADPPWDYKTPGQIGKTLEHRPNRDIGESKMGAGSVARYGSMSHEELSGLVLPAAESAHLYLWTTNAFIDRAHALAHSWGFRPITVLTWVKIRRSDGRPSMKMGYYFRGATEHIVFAVRGSMRLVSSRALPTAYLWPRERHSRKPDAFYDLVEEASPGPFLELFARRKRPGWHHWGAEIESDVEIAMRGGRE